MLSIWPSSFPEIYLGHSHGHNQSDPVELAKWLYVVDEINLLEFEQLTDLMILGKGLSPVTCPRCGEPRKGLRVNDSMAALRCECGFSGYVDGA